MRHLKTAATALLIGFVLMTTVDYAAYAATGKSLLLGKVNKAGRTTTMQNTGSGPAVAFKVKNGSAAPFSVNGTGRVAKLNADRLDGRHAEEFALAAQVPVALGYVNSPGSLNGGLGVAGVDWENGAKRYLITLTDTTYVNSGFATLVTPTCDGYTVSTQSSSGDLVVKIRNTSGTAVQCPFAFVVYDV